MNLFIIGNGFDRAHGLPTAYIDFRDYLEREDWSYLVKLEEPYGYVPESKRDLVEKYLWKEFENNLTDINESEIVDGATSIDMGLEGGDVGIEDTLNDYWEEQYGYVQRLNDYLKTWVEHIDIHVLKKTKKIKEFTDDLFLSFNYTLLLEKTYKIDSYQVLHIHGCIDKSVGSPPVIGHGNKEKIKKSKEAAHKASENFWEKDSSIYSALANYYERTLKDVSLYIYFNSEFFKRLKSVKQIYVVGHSLGDVDLPYFKKVVESIQEDVMWNIYYYSNEEKTLFMEKIISVGVKVENIRMLPAAEFFDKA